MFSVPHTPTGYRKIKELHGKLNTTVTFQKNLQTGSGSAAIVDNYTITIVPRPLSHPSHVVVTAFPWSVTFAHNILYYVYITAINCAGNSNTLQLSPIEYSNKILSFFVHLLTANFIVNCGDPNPPINGSLSDFTHTREGASVNFSCNDGFLPSKSLTSICMYTGMWMPPPDEHVCTLFTGILKN